MNDKGRESYIFLIEKETNELLTFLLLAKNLFQLALTTANCDNGIQFPLDRTEESDWQCIKSRGRGLGLDKLWKAKLGQFVSFSW